MKCLIKVTQQGCGFTKVDEYIRSFESQKDLDGFLINEEEYLNSLPGLKRQVTAEQLVDPEEVIDGIHCIQYLGF